MRGGAPSWRNADLGVRAGFADVPRQSPLRARQTGTWRARVPPLGLAADVGLPEPRHRRAARDPIHAAPPALRGARRQRFGLRAGSLRVRRAPVPARIQAGDPTGADRLDAVSDRLRPLTNGLDSRGRGRHSNRPVVRADELTGEKAHVLAALHNPSPPRKPSGAGGAEELNMKIERRRELVLRQRRDQRRTQSVIEHRGQEPALDHTDRVRELIARLKGNLDSPLLRIHVDQLPAEKHRCRWRWDPPCLHVPEQPTPLRIHLHEPH